MPRNEYPCKRPGCKAQPFATVQSLLNHQRFSHGSTAGSLSQQKAATHSRVSGRFIIIPAGKWATSGGDLLELATRRAARMAIASRNDVYVRERLSDGKLHTVYVAKYRPESGVFAFPTPLKRKDSAK